MPDPLPIDTKKGVLWVLRCKDIKPQEKPLLRSLKKNLRNDLEIQKEYILQDGYYRILDINPELLKNKELRRRALKHIGMVEWYILYEDGYFSNSKRARKALEEIIYIKNITDFNYEDLLLLVEKDPYILLLTKENYFNDKKIMLEAVKCNMQILDYAGENLLKDIDIFNAALESKLKWNFNKVWSLFDSSLFKDKKIVLEIIKENYYIYEKLPENLKNDDDIINYAKKDIYNLQFLPDKYKNSSEFVLSTIKEYFKAQNMDSYYYLYAYGFHYKIENKLPIISKELLNDKKFMKKICSIKPKNCLTNNFRLLKLMDLGLETEMDRGFGGIELETEMDKSFEDIKLEIEMMENLEDIEIPVEMFESEMEKFYISDEEKNKIFLKQKELILAGEQDINKIISCSKKK